MNVPGAHFGFLGKKGGEKGGVIEYRTDMKRLLHLSKIASAKSKTQYSNVYIKLLLINKDCT